MKHIQKMFLFFSSHYLNLLFFLLLLLMLFARFYNLNWDSSHYLHPDERLYVNASNITFPETFTKLFSPASPLNPHMFYYGPFPLYIYIAFSTLWPTSNFLLESRMISALVSFLTIPFIYLIGKEIFSKKIGVIAAIVFGFSAGSIQHAHFITTESMLTFLLTLITYLSIKAVKHHKYSLLIPLAFLIAIAYATKITGITFAIIPLLAMVLLFVKERRLKKSVVYAFAFFIIVAIMGIILAPYQIIDYAKFRSEQEYMQGVTYGIYKPPFIIIYENSLPYIYPLLKIFPFTFGFLSLSLAIGGLFLLLKRFLNKKERNLLSLFVFLFPLVYFLWSGYWYAKFSRYYILLFPFLSLWAAYYLYDIKKLFLYLFLILITINGMLYLTVYTRDNTRIKASEWIYANIPSGNVVAGEHWDDNLPLPLTTTTNTKYINLQLAVYDQDTDGKIKTLAENLSRSDYFIISSRRVYQSILNNKKAYPYTSKFYEQLFANNLGFILVKKETNYPYFFSDDLADETFQSYDHPPVYIFKNILRLTPDQIRAYLQL